jgi:hypothetical protein
LPPCLKFDPQFFLLGLMGGKLAEIMHLLCSPHL